MLRLARAVSRLFTLLLAIAVGVVVVLLLAIGGVTWRLTQGPLEVTALARHLVPLVAPGVTASHVTVALERRDGERLLRLSVADAERAAEADQPAQSVRNATVAIALSPLLLGRLAPEEVVVEGARLHLVRSISGKQRPPSGRPDGLGTEMRRLLSSLRHVAITDAQVSVADGELGQSWTVTDGTADLQRQPDGAIAGRASATGAIGDVSATVSAEGRYTAEGATLGLTVSPVSPAALAKAVKPLAALQALDAPVGMHVDASFGPGMQPLQAVIHAQAGPGVASLPAEGGGSSAAKFASLSLDLTVTPAHATLRALRLVLQPPSASPPTTLVLSGTADRAAGRFQAHLAIDLDHAAFADLPTLWPAGVGGGARAWLTENLTAGTAHDGHFTLTVAGAETGDDIALTEAGGQLTGDDVTAYWLRPVPPIEHGHAVVTWQNPDTVLVAVSNARQGTLSVTGGSVRITGLTVKDQVAAIAADVAGPLADLFTLLRHPRLRLLSAHPVPVTAPTGMVTAHLTVQLPLDSKVTVDQVAIHASGQVANTHLGSVAAGRDLDRGQLAFDVTNDGLTVSGPAQLDHMPGKLALEMDFRTGPPSQVVQHAAVTLRVTERDAKAAGLAAIGLVAGTMATALDYSERRDGGATLRVTGDLREAGFTTPLGWSKAVGSSGHFEGQALLSHGKLVGLEGLHAEAPGLAIQASSDLVGGVPAVVHLQRADIGRSSATGTIGLPQREGDPYRVTLSGPRLDLEGRLKTQDAPAAADREAARRPGSPPGTPYIVDLKFQRVIFGTDRSIGPVALNASGDGRRLVEARLVTSGPEQVQADLVSSGTERKLWATAANLGLLLRDTDLAGEVTGGALILDGSFDDRTAGSPFSGKVDLRNFTVQGAPVFGKVLQGMTLYGLVDALRGPGLSFDRFVMPFRLEGPILDLEDAQAYSSSLGVTATGRLDFGRKQLDLKGTIVPAYFFNSLPGRVPLLGRLFSPEKGGGVFAATYGLRGSLLDPSVAINPLSALTPGFTRRLFDLFD